MYKINKSISFNTYYGVFNKILFIKKKKKTIPSTYTNHKEEFHFIHNLIFYFRLFR